jgi:hypothetical protein
MWRWIPVSWILRAVETVTRGEYPRCVRNQGGSFVKQVPEDKLTDAGFRSAGCGAVKLPESLAYARPRPNGGGGANSYYPHTTSITARTMFFLFEI